MLPGYVFGGGMVLVQVTLKHVLHSVGGVKHASAKVLARFVESIEQHSLPVLVVRVALGKKCVIIEDLLVEGPRVFSKSKSSVGSEKFGQINRISHWVRDGQIRLARIDVHGSYIDFYLGRDFFQKETADAARTGAQLGFEFYRDPFRIVAELEQKALGTDQEPRGV